MAIKQRSAEQVEHLARRVGRLDGAYENVADIPPVERQRMINEYITDYLDGLTATEREALDTRIRAILAGPLAEQNAWYRGDYDHADWSDIITAQAVSAVMIHEASGRQLPDPEPWWARYVTERNI